MACLNLPHNRVTCPGYSFIVMDVDESFFVTEFHTLWLPAAKVAFKGFAGLTESDSGWCVWAGFFAIMTADARCLINDSRIGALVYLQCTRWTILQTWSVRALLAQDWFKLYIHCVRFCPILDYKNP
ncbi:MAG: hypothetical protein QME90_12580 [Thermodesulfobacteriota bacterium]|nr:hypothetical protein [Thermodesulfobacteriota bacterium]